MMLANENHLPMMNMCLEATLDFQLPCKMSEARRNNKKKGIQVNIVVVKVLKKD